MADESRRSCEGDVLRRKGQTALDVRRASMVLDPIRTQTESRLGVIVVVVVRGAKARRNKHASLFPPHLADGALANQPRLITIVATALQL